MRNATLESRPEIYQRTAVFEALEAIDDGQNYGGEFQQLSAME